jgi:hypothetical protein
METKSRSAGTAAKQQGTYPVPVVMVAEGLNSCPCDLSSSARFQSSRHVSLLKSTSTAPDLVPVAIHGVLASGDQAKAAVRGISRSRTMVDAIWEESEMGGGTD